MSKVDKVLKLSKEEIGAPYVYGARGGLCTPRNRKDRSRPDYPTIVSKCQVLNGSKKNCDGCKYNGRRMYDCRGFTYWVFLQVGINISGQGATSQYNTKSNWAKHGPICDMPKDKVCCIFKHYDGKMQHTGIYLGNGKVRHCSGEVKEEKLSKSWTHYAIPKGLYTEEELAMPSETAMTEPTESVYPTLKRGSAGADVTIIQQKLTDLGYDLGIVDGIFGTKTTAAVKKFQKDFGLKADGIVGSQTWSALLSTNETSVKYKVTIGNLSKAQAELLAKQYPTAIVSPVK